MAFWNMFIINNKNTKTTLMRSSGVFFFVSIADFEQVIYWKNYPFLAGKITPLMPGGNKKVTHT